MNFILQLIQLLIFYAFVTTAFWSNPYLYITNPPQIAGEYQNIFASSFTPFPNADFYGSLSLAEPILGCTALTSNHTGKICVIERGGNTIVQR